MSRFKLTTAHHAGRLLCTLPLLGPAKVYGLFGPPPPGGYEDEEKGYDGIEWNFEDTTTGAFLTLYARFGAFRVGGECEASARAFAKWVMEVPYAPTPGEVALRIC